MAEEAVTCEPFSAPKFLANREKYREFRQMRQSKYARVSRNLSISSEFRSNSRFQPWNLTGNYQGLIREFSTVHQRIRFRLEDVHDRLVTPIRAGSLLCE
jgi:hypothetical protein